MSLLFDSIWGDERYLTYSFVSDIAVSNGHTFF